MLRSITEIVPSDVVLGQYSKDPKGTGDAALGYLDDPTVPQGELHTIITIILSPCIYFM